jgi:hypothetical protein
MTTNAEPIIVTVDEQRIFITISEPESTRVIEVRDGGGGGGSAFTGIRRFEFTNSMSWLVTHNRSTDKFIAQVWNAAGAPMFAAIAVIDENSFRVNLTYPTSGYVDVIFGEPT